MLGEDPAVAGRRWRDRIGVVAQGEGGGPALSVRETLDHFAGYHAMTRPTGELLAAVGLEESAGVRVERLSGGQRRRLAVALGVQGRPGAALPRRADHRHGPGRPPPVLGADPRSCASDGTTILLTTHYLDEAAELADRVGRRSPTAGWSTWRRRTSWARRCAGSRR